MEPKVICENLTIVHIEFNSSEDLEHSKMACDKLSLSVQNVNKNKYLYTGDGIHIQFEGDSSATICVKNEENKYDDNIKIMRFYDSKLELLNQNSTEFKTYFKSIIFKNRRNLEIVNRYEKISKSFTKIITRIKCNKDYLVVATLDEYFIYKLPSLLRIHTFYNESTNPDAVFDITTNHQNLTFLAVPCQSSDESEGIVRIYNITNISEQTRIYAHRHPLNCIVFSPDGSKIATSTVQGLTIKVFSNDTRYGFVKLFEFRRGFTPVEVAINFSPCGEYIITTSNTTTVHIFKLENRAKEESWFSFTTRFISRNFHKSLTLDRAFAMAYLPENNGKCMATLIRENETQNLIVFNDFGIIYIYKFDAKHGGDCKLTRKFDLFHI